MPESIQHIHALLDRLARRERRVIGLESITWAALAWLGAWAAVVVAVNVGWTGTRTGGIWLGILVASGFVAGAFPLRAWAEARDRRRQALRMEAHEPALRGELLTVVDRVARPIGPQSLIARARRHEESGTARWLKLQRSLIKTRDLLIAFRRHPTSLLSKSRSSHARAKLQSLRTVRGVTFRTAPISSSVNPPKKRNSTTWHLR